MVDALASGLPVAQDHLQVLERLRQLTAWQQAQQERLRRHQQEQIARLRGEQERLGGQPAAGLTPVEHSYATAHPDRVQPQSLAGPALSHRQLSPTPACTLHPTPPTVAARDEERDSSVRQLAPDRTVSDQSLEDHEGAPLSHGGDGAREVAVGGRGCEASSDSGLGMGGQGSEEGSLTACSDESSLASEKEVEQFPTLGEREGGGGVEKPSLDEVVPRPAVDHTDRPIRPGVDHTDRPIRPGVGEGGTFEDLLERQLHALQEEDPSPSGHSQVAGGRRPFLRRGEGIARFGLKQRKLKSRSQHKPKAGLGSKSRETPPPTVKEEDKVLHKSVSQELLGRKRGVAREGGLAQSASQDGLWSSTGTIPQAVQRASTPLGRFSSDESFIIRGHQRVKQEEAELQEFELLERAAGNCSFFSQCSLVQQALNEEREEGEPRDTGPSLSPRPELVAFAVGSCSSGGSETEGGSTISDREQEALSVSAKSETAGEGTSGPCDLDETLTPALEGVAGAAGPSLAAGVVFSDEEVWESFSHGSPPRSHWEGGGGRGKEEEAGVAGDVSGGWSTSTSPWASPVRREQLDSEGVPVLSTPIPTTALPHHQHHHQQLTQHHGPTDTQGGVAAPGQPQPVDSHPPPPVMSRPTPRLTVSGREGGPGSEEGGENTEPSLPPPPSALAARLFPALRRERERVIQQQKQASLQQMVASSATPTSDAPPPPPQRLSEEAPPPAVSAELREKLCQLETEIERFRLMNAKLERLTKEKDQSLAFLKSEIAELQRQKLEEVEKFEEYRREEMRKLRKERRVFDAYVQECRAGRERKDREEMEALRSEVQQLRAELLQREERWKASLTRYRLRVEGLEGQNRELQNDLRVMEQERLVWWQQQLQQPREQREKQITSPAPIPGTVPQTDRAKPAMKPTAKKPVVSKPHKTTSRRPAQERDLAKESRAPPMGTARPDRSRPTQHKLPSQPVGARASGDEDLLPSIRDGWCGETGECEIVEVVSRDLPPPSDSEGDSLSDAGSDLSAMAEQIVEEVLGTGRERGEDGGGKGGGGGGEGEEGGGGERKEREGERSRGRDGVGGVVKCVKWETEAERQQEQREACPVEEAVGGRQGKRREDEQRGRERMAGKAGERKAATVVAKSVRFSLGSHSTEQPKEEGGRESGAREEGAMEEAVVAPQQVETVQEDGSKVMVCANGTRKVISADGRSITLHFFNGDIKHIKPDLSVVYYYSQSRTTHTTHPDGTEVLLFPNQQTEKLFPNGTREIQFPDGTMKCVYASGEEKSVFRDGTVQRLLASGDRIIQYANGQKETHTADYKRREYPDGTVKTVYPDGRQETRYASGRLRVKDSSGQVLVDTGQEAQH